jgi:hypothetical protein
MVTVGAAEGEPGELGELDELDAGAAVPVPQEVIADEAMRTRQMSAVEEKTLNDRFRIAIALGCWFRTFVMRRERVLDNTRR